MFETISACIQCNPKDVAKVVLMPGDPLRAQFIAEYYLENAFRFNTVRNMFGYTGFYKDERISVMGSGMGIPSMCLYAQELYMQLGVEAIIRIGTAGGLANNVGLHDVIIADSAATNSNVPSIYGFPSEGIPAPSSALLNAARAASEKYGEKTHVGELFTTDLFYDPRSDEVGRMQRAGYLAVDMETAGLYVEALLNEKEALSICTCSNHLMTGDALSAQEREQSFDTMIRVALESVVNL